MSSTRGARTGIVAKVWPVALGASLAAAVTVSWWWASEGGAAPVRLGQEAFAAKYRGLARQLARAEYESGSRAAIRELPCLAAFRARHPETPRVWGTLALRIVIRQGLARIIDVGSTGGNVDAKFTTCLRAAWPWLARVYSAGHPATLADADFWTPVQFGAKLRAAYPPVPSDWAMPERWDEGAPPGWRTIVERMKRPPPPMAAAPQPEFSAGEPLVLGAFLQRFPFLADELWEPVFSGKDAQRSFEDCFELSDGWESFDEDVLTVAVSVRGGKARLRPLFMASDRGNTRYAQCAFRTIGLQDAEYSVLGTPDTQVLVQWPFRRKA